MTRDYVAPEFKLDAFNCPHCGAYAHVSWREMRYRSGAGFLKGLTMEAQCLRCQDVSVWLGQDGSMLWPRDTGNAPLPHVDMPEEIRKDYNEARSICNASPRGTAALLRLAIQKLCAHLGEPGKSINDDIGSLVRKGLPAQVQQALDIVRVTGNNAVHPGEMQLDDDQRTVSSLFHLLNLIVENQVAQPKAIADMYSKLPKGALGGIEGRDKTAEALPPSSD